MNEATLLGIGMAVGGLMVVCGVAIGAAIVRELMRPYQDSFEDRVDQVERHELLERQRKHGRRTREEYLLNRQAEVDAELIADGELRVFEFDDESELDDEEDTED